MIHFPTIHGRTLAGEALTLPYDFDGEFIALALTFNPTQQIETRTWLPILQDAMQTYSQFVHYEVPVLNEFKVEQQDVVYATMQRSITDATRQQQVLPIFVNKQALRRQLKIVSERSICVLLLDREGFVYWRADGFASLLKQAQFRRALSHVAPQVTSDHE